MNDECKRLLDDCKLELDGIEDWINKNLIHSNVRYLVSYSIVKASGTIEYVFKQMMYEYLSDGSKEDTKLYLEKQIIDSACNPKIGNMLRLLAQSGKVKSDLFKSKTDNTQEKSDLGSLVSLRNDIAHGRTNNATISTIKKYFRSGETILTWLEEVLESIYVEENE